MLLNTFPSGANRVTLHGEGGRLWVEKQYAEKLTGYPVSWPVSRGEVEAALLNFFSRYTEGKKIRFPRVYSWEPPDLLLMEYCCGRPLSVCRKEDLKHPALWQALFDFLYSLKDISRDIPAGPAYAALCRQGEIQLCMLREKIGDEAALTGFAREMPESFCLGDLSLNNILLEDGHFCLLDFECAHWGRQGYDAGQLLAMSRACWKDSPLYSIIETAFLQSSADPVYRHNAFVWKEKFLPFYDRRYARLRH